MEPERDFEEIEAAIFAATKTVIDLCAGTPGSSISPAAAIELARCAVAALNTCADVDSMTELLQAYPQLKCAVFGQILMNHLPSPDGPLSPDDKTFLLSVAAYMGLDWLESMRRSAAFMIRVEGFN